MYRLCSGFLYTFTFILFIIVLKSVITDYLFGLTLYYPWWSLKFHLFSLVRATDKNEIHNNKKVRSTTPQSFHSVLFHPSFDSIFVVLYWYLESLEHYSFQEQLLRTQAVRDCFGSAWRSTTLLSLNGLPIAISSLFSWDLHQTAVQRLQSALNVSKSHRGQILHL